MNTRVWLSTILLAALASMTGCYTSFRAPVQVQDEAIAEDYSLQAQQSENEYEDYYQGDLSMIPGSVANDYDWYFYYISPWWSTSAYSPVPSNANRSVPETRDFGRRQPEMRTPRVGPAASTVGPGSVGVLSKTPADSNKKDEKSDDSRRGVGRRTVTKKNDDTNSSDTRSRKDQ